MGRSATLVVIALLAALLIGLVAGLIFAFTYVITMLYLVGGVLLVTFSILALRARSRDNSLDRVSFRFFMEAGTRRYGRSRFWIARLLVESVGILNWPIEVIRSLWLLRKGGPATARKMVMGQAAAPAWIAPPALTFVALLLLNSRSDDLPLKLVAFCFVLSTFLSLVATSLVRDVKEEVLARAGVPAVSFILILVLNLGCAALSRLLILHWSGEPLESLPQSVYSILSFADMRSVAERFHLTASEIANDPWTLRNLLRVPRPDSLCVLLDVLFYLSFLRVGLEAFSLRREARHFLVLGAAHAALGDYDSSEKMLRQAKNELSARLLIAAMRLARRDYKEVSRVIKNACALANIAYSAEEEATLSLIYANDGIPMDAETLAEYLDVRGPEFGDPHAAALLAIIVGPLLTNGSQWTAMLAPAAPLRDDPLFGLFRELEGGEIEGFHQQLDALAERSACATFLRILLRLIAIAMETFEGSPDAAGVAALRSEIESLAERSGTFAEQWQTLIGYLALQRSRAFHLYCFQVDEPTLAGVVREFRDMLEQGEMFAGHMGALDAVFDRERTTTVNELRQLGGREASPPDRRSEG
jgi:hypothetical protein